MSPARVRRGPALVAIATSEFLSGRDIGERPRARIHSIDAVVGGVACGLAACLSLIARIREAPSGRRCWTPRLGPSIQIRVDRDPGRARVDADCGVRAVVRTMRAVEGLDLVLNDRVIAMASLPTSRSTDNCCIHQFRATVLERLRSHPERGCGVGSRPLGGGLMSNVVQTPGGTAEGVRRVWMRPAPGISPRGVFSLMAGRSSRTVTVKKLARGHSQRSCCSRVEDW